jgi:hypothetical protein
MIDVSEVVNASEMAQPFQILRSTGAFNNGNWNSEEQTIQAYGVITIADAKALEMVPQGDIVHGAMAFYSQDEIHVTHENGGTGGSSDILIWRGGKFRVLSVKRFIDYGFFMAVATRMKLAS